jgi:propanediol dehydratase small subunit
MSVTYIVILGIVIFLASAFYVDGLPKKYRLRKCMGKYWKSEFPNSSKKDIREFLILFTDAFAFSNKDKLNFAPNDKIYDIYTALYPSKWMADSLELETLAIDIENQYSLCFNELWSEDLTLGELFSRIKNT